MAHWLLATIVSSGLAFGVSTAEVQSRTTLTYDEFAQLPEDRRDAVFAQLGPEDKAAFLRTRFERWLEEHRNTLSSRQIAAVREATDLVTPRMFEGPPDAAMRARLDAVAKKLSCSLGSERAYSFANGTPAPDATKLTWSAVAESWTEWLVECVLSSRR